MVHLKINRLPHTHIVDRYFEAVRLFNVTNDHQGLDFFIPDEDEISPAEMSMDLQKGYIAFVIGAKHGTKKLTPEKIIGICRLVDHPIVLLGGSEDVDTGKLIENTVGGKILNACGQYTINQSASLVKQAKLVITHDTGMMHIAAAFQKRIVSIWGNTIPEFGMYPYLPDPGSVMVEVKNLSCRPCSKIGFETCPKKHFKCIQDIDIEYIADIISGYMTG